MPRLIELSAAGKGPPCTKLAPVPAIPHAAGGAIPVEALNPPKPPRGVCPLPVSLSCYRGCPFLPDGFLAVAAPHISPASAT